MFGLFLETVKFFVILVEQLFESAHISCTRITLCLPIVAHIAGAHTLVSELLIVAASFIGLFESVFYISRI